MVDHEMGDLMADEANSGAVRFWALAVTLAVVLALLVLTFPYMGVSGCPSGATLTAGGNDCTNNLLSWHGWVRFPYWEWLPWVYFVAILGVVTALVLTVRRALRSG
jgi:hypothetical protein